MADRPSIAFRLTTRSVALLLSSACASAADSANDIEFFEKQIRPLFVEKCQKCHGATKREGGLSLTGRKQVVQGGDSGRAIVPGKPDDSLMIKAVEYRSELKMPPNGKLTGRQIARLRDWVQRGAPWPQSTSTQSSPSTTEAGGGQFQTTDQQRTWWAWQPVRDPMPPEVATGLEDWPLNNIDRFVAARLIAAGMKPADEADRRTWIRRATFDLTGLPPTPAGGNSFLRDASPGAHGRVVDRLLASPAYGQRWARHWLDVVRYADYYDHNPKTRTASCESTEAWRYRDWVVDSLNRDLPYDQFIVHQIAGDLLPSPTSDEVYPDGLIATTFLSNGVWDRGDADKEKIVSDMADDQIDTIGKAFLGLTFGCARCHDHKFDPVSHEDYYALAGIFYSSHILETLGVKGGEYTLKRSPLVPKAVVDARRKQEQAIAAVNAKIGKLDKKQERTQAEDAERARLIDQRARLESELPPPIPVAMAAQEGGTPGGLFPGIQDVPVHIRGSYTRLGKVIPRRMPAFFAGKSPPVIKQGSGRRELAQWITSRDNRLTARVIVNRVWQKHFGEGLVRTPNNFGLQSQPPSHPDLLDWLVTRFVDDGWSLKKLHRQIMLSAAYRQTSVVPPGRAESDPDNRWLGRFAARRLEAEAIRDAIMFVAGTLDRNGGGPAGDDLMIARRSLYVQTARFNRSSYAMLFDAANPDASTEKRIVSTVAPQSLFLLNHEFVLGQAQALASRLQRGGPNTTSRIGHAFQLLYGRPPSQQEHNVARELLEEAGGVDSHEAWVDLAHVLLCSNEFFYLD